MASAYTVAQSLRMVPSGVHVVRVEGGLQPGGQRTELGCLFGPADQLRRLGDQACAAIQGRGRDHTGVCLCVGRIVRRRIGVEPVGELVALVPQARR